uniref:Integrase core domain-containing protein n=2 Tax=Amphimedon queenslandica TaxID=400682 RepID=A0A1X7UFU3_AMPQE
MQNSYLSVRNDLIKQYTSIGATSKEVQSLFELKYGRKISVRQIQRVKKQKGLSTMKEESSLELIIQAIKEELKAHGKLLGYRAMQKRLQLTYGLVVRRRTVMMLIRVLDENGSDARQKRRLQRRIYHSKGPNFCWHCDGYDKLKKFGIAIHACIDGFSRRIMWLDASSSNNNPKFIAHYYIQCVKENEGCPQLLRTDKGSENSNLAVIQPILRHFHTDSLSGKNSHRYGKSTTNQRVEAFWSQLRRSYSDWWMSFFKVCSVVLVNYCGIHTI